MMDEVESKVNEQEAYDITWVICVEREVEGKYEEKIGGGICVNSEGAILTASHVIPEIGPYKILARSERDKDMRYAVLANRYPQFDLAVLWVEKKQDKEKVKDETFPFYQFPSNKNLPLTCEDIVFAYHHKGGLTYSYDVGRIAYPLCADAHIPALVDPRTMRKCLVEMAARDLEKRDDLDDEEQELLSNCSRPLKSLKSEELVFPTRKDLLRHNSFSYRTSGLIMDVDEGIFHDLHPTLPLVQISTMGCGPASSGCPIFLKSDGSLVGIISRGAATVSFAIPVRVLHMVANEVPSRPDDMSFQAIDIWANVAQLKPKKKEEEKHKKNERKEKQPRKRKSKGEVKRRRKKRVFEQEASKAKEQEQEPYDITWVVHVEREFEGTYAEETGGGICVNREGAILCASHLIPETGPYNLLARSKRDKDMRNAVLANRYPQFGLAVLWVEKKDKERVKDETFPFYNFPSNKNLLLTCDDIVFAYHHRCGFLYSHNVGHVAYPYPLVADTCGFPVLTDPRTIQECYQEQFFRRQEKRDDLDVDYSNICRPLKSLTPEELIFPEMDDLYRHNYFTHRTASMIVELVVDNLMNLHPHLPVIQISKIRCDRGLSGCPIFLKSDGSLIGMILSGTYLTVIAVPIAALRMVAETVSGNRPDDLSFQHVDIAAYLDRLEAKNKEKEERKKRGGKEKKQCTRKSEGEEKRCRKKKEHLQ